MNVIPDEWVRLAWEAYDSCVSNCPDIEMRHAIAAVAPLIAAAERERLARERLTRDYNELREAHDAKAAEIVRLQAVVRVNGLRHGATHAEVDAMLFNPTTIRTRSAP